MKIFSQFWQWYEKHEKLNLAITNFLFLWQLVHLFWLTTDVVFGRLFGEGIFQPSELPRLLLVLVDYTEIPALITASIYYVNQHRKNFHYKNLLFLLFINLQWLHLFWITDEFVITEFSQDAKVPLPTWLAWTAILIDYLELPIIYDTTKKMIINLARRGPPPTPQ